MRLPSSIRRLRSEELSATVAGEMPIDGGTTDAQGLGVAGDIDIDIDIDRTFGLNEVPDALRYVGEGLAHGKVVVTIDGAV
jgi:hypothetical protein